MRRKLRYSSAFNGISVLDLPSDRLQLSRGVYSTYRSDLMPQREAIRRKLPQQNMKDDAKSKETRVVIDALRKLMRQQKTTEQAQFGTERPA